MVSFGGPGSDMISVKASLRRFGDRKLFTLFVNTCAHEEKPCTAIYTVLPARVGLNPEA